MWYLCEHTCREELQEKIAELEVQVAGIAVNNPRVVEEYMKRQADIEKLAQDLAAQRAELDSLHTEIEQLKVRLRCLLERVSVVKQLLWQVGLQRQVEQLKVRLRCLLERRVC
jgi:chromosome segregation ATPase